MTDRPPSRLPHRERASHKGNFGRALLIGGSRGMCGSIALSSMAALKTGSGLVTAAVPDRCLEAVGAYHPCLMTVPMPDDGEGRFALQTAPEIGSRVSSADAIGCGPGMTTQPGSVRLVERLLADHRVPRVFDADAINSLAELGPVADLLSVAGSLVLTPHPGEFQRISGVSAQDRPAQIDAAADLARQTGCVIVLKGGPTVVAGRDDIWTNETGNPGMATAGSGDVLTGVITSLLGQGLDGWDAARLGVWTHGLAGDLAARRHGQGGMTALEILEALPEAIAAVH